MKAHHTLWIATLTANLLLGGNTFAGALPRVDGPFQPTQDSLTNYVCPDWFRDAKFGIWSHWGPQSVPMDGDWYARHMYIEDHPQYQHHVRTYGHPSKFGFKDIARRWKAEKFDPERGFRFSVGRELG